MGLDLAAGVWLLHKDLHLAASVISRLLNYLSYGAVIWWSYRESNSVLLLARQMASPMNQPRLAVGAGIEPASHFRGLGLANQHISALSTYYLAAREGLEPPRFGFGDLAVPELYEL